jgi:hypothetical protein
MASGKTRFVLLVINALLFGACSENDRIACDWAPKKIPWHLEAANAEWRPRDSAGEFVFKDRLWLLGGWFDSFQLAPRDIWSSTDGRKWELETKQAEWTDSDVSASLVFKNYAWLLGGWKGGRLPGAKSSNEVWRSADGKTWEMVVNAPWTARLGTSAVVFRDRLWILGGIEEYHKGNASSLKNDVWSSPDGISWERHLEHAPWDPRAFHAAFVFKDRLWLVGGGNYTPGFFAMNDVWNTSDGIHWERVSESAPWSPRIWFSSAVYRDVMWVLGGWVAPYQNLGDVWYSTDGLHWAQLDMSDAWLPRHEHSTYVFDDRLWIVGGLANGLGLSQEVWSLNLPTKWQPSCAATSKPAYFNWLESARDQLGRILRF